MVYIIMVTNRVSCHYIVLEYLFTKFNEELFQVSFQTTGAVYKCEFSFVKF